MGAIHRQSKSRNTHVEAIVDSSRTRVRLPPPPPCPMRATRIGLFRRGVGDPRRFHVSLNVIADRYTGLCPKLCSPRRDFRGKCFGRGFSTRALPQPLAAELVDVGCVRVRLHVR